MAAGFGCGATPGGQGLHLNDMDSPLQGQCDDRAGPDGRMGSINWLPVHADMAMCDDFLRKTAGFGEADKE